MQYNIYQNPVKRTEYDVYRRVRHHLFFHRWEYVITLESKEEVFDYMSKLTRPSSVALYELKNQD